MEQTMKNAKCGGERHSEAGSPVEAYPQSHIQGDGSQLWDAQGIYVQLQGKEMGNQPCIAVVTSRFSRAIEAHDA